MTQPTIQIRVQQLYQTKLKNHLFSWYRYPVIGRLQTNNLFLTVPKLTISGYNVSAGLLTDYQRKKKKKKSYMLGLDLGTIFGDKLKMNGIQSLRLRIKGSGAQKKGIFHALLRHKFAISSLTNITPLVHNGTRPVKKRRL